MISSHEFGHETLIKRHFKSESWNRLDMFIVVISIMSIVLNRFVDFKTMPIDPTLIRVIRVIRIARVLKLLKTARGIRSLLATVGESLPQVGNLALLFGLIFFIFSTLGVELFGKLSKLLFVYLNRHANSTLL